MFKEILFVALHKSLRSVFSEMMAEDKEKIDTVEMEAKRLSKPTERALEDKLHRLIAARRGKLGQITGKINETESLLNHADNLQTVKGLVEYDINTLITEMRELTEEIGDLLSEEEKKADLTNWFEPKMLNIAQFKDKAKQWMDALRVSELDEEPLDNDEEEEEEDEEDEDEEDKIGPADSSSQIEELQRKTI